MKKTGWIIYNGNLPGDKFLDYATMLHEAAERQNSVTKIIKNNDVLALLDSTRLGIVPKSELPDYVIFTDKDIYLARQLELLGVPVFNRSSVIETCDDKILTYQVLAHHQLPIPRTIIAPKVFFNQEEQDLPDLKSITEELGLPLIVKEAFGSFGEQVYLIHSVDDLEQLVRKLYGKPFMFQEFISASSGKDIRVQVVGDQVVAAMKRTASGDFRANITAGGKMEPIELSHQAKEIAIAAAKAIGADFCGIDLLFGEDDDYYICEINSNAHIRNLYDCTGINVADSIVSYILTKLGD